MVAVQAIIADPSTWNGWIERLVSSGGDFTDILRTAVLAFPLLVLGLSGFETGVSMMPLVKAIGITPYQRLASRVRNTRKLLTTAAVIMSVYLIGTSLVTTILIPEELFEPGGEANGRAIAYLAHLYLGEAFGTAYDISSILILWFAGASAMAGLINIVPRYLPAYGMAPEWSRAVRPVVLVYTGISIAITIAFGADVDAQAGAYATGILAMMVSAAFAVTISAARKRQLRASLGFAVVTLVLGYALIANVIAQPDGIAISGLFIAGIVLVSVVSRVYRATELRVNAVELNRPARRMIAEAIRHDGTLNIIANRRHTGRESEYADKEASQRAMNPIPFGAKVIFLEIDVADPSDFTQSLEVRGSIHDGYRILRVDEHRGAERDRGSAHRAARCDRRATPMPLRVGRGTPDRLHVPLLPVRARRHRPARSGDPARGGEGPVAQAGRPRRRIGLSPRSAR